MEARDNLRLAIQARTFPLYFLMESSNTVQPLQIIGNKVTGTLFENKVDHATYFGGNSEYIQGIHLIPQNSSSSLIRSPNFGVFALFSMHEVLLRTLSSEGGVGAYFSNGRVDQVGGNWRDNSVCQSGSC